MAGRKEGRGKGGMERSRDESVEGWRSGEMDGKRAEGKRKGWEDGGRMNESMGR